MSQQIFRTNDLPRQISNIKEAKRLLKDSDAAFFTTKAGINRALSFIEPGELLYYMTESYTKIKNMETNETGTDVYYVILSDRRLLFVNQHKNNLLIPLEDVRAVESGQGIILEKISFRTPSLSVIFDHAANSNRIRELIINVLRYHQQADDMDTTRLESTSHGVDSTRKSRVVVCPGCAATVFVRGDVSKCEYCNRYVD